MIGKELKILFESENHGGNIKGFSSNYVKVNNQFNEQLVNKFVKVKILSAGNEECSGEVKGIKKSIELIAC
jgi:threonylcarbamoyladenosine tRNA methylthiotransferase MtaB